MDIKHIERIIGKFVSQNEVSNGELKFIVGDDALSKKEFYKSDGFMPLIVVVSQSLEKMLGGRLSSEELFKIGESEDGLLSKEVLINESASPDIPINTVLLTISSAVDMMLDEKRNPYIKKNSEGVREVDLISMVSDMHQVSLSMTSKVFSISIEALERMYEGSNQDEMVQGSEKAM